MGLLRRLINNLKERGSEVAEELERKAHNFLTDVKSKKKPALQSFESDEESEWEGSEWEEEEEVPFSLPPPPARPSLPSNHTRGGGRGTQLACATQVPHTSP